MSLIPQPYSACGTSKADEPALHGISGPGQGLGYHAWNLFPENTFEPFEAAKKTARLMNLAFEQGRRAKMAEIREVLGG